MAITNPAPLAFHDAAQNHPRRGQRDDSRKLLLRWRRWPTPRDRGRRDGFEALDALDRHNQDWDLAVVDLFLKEGSGIRASACRAVPSPPRAHGARRRQRTSHGRDPSKRRPRPRRRWRFRQVHRTRSLLRSLPFLWRLESPPARAVATRFLASSWPWSRLQRLLMPPSITSSLPTVNFDSSEARKTTALAISEGSPKRPAGTWPTAPAIFGARPGRACRRAASRSGRG